VVGGRAARDPSATLPGRGAYVCDAACAAVAARRGAFARALRTRVEISADFVESS